VNVKNGSSFGGHRRLDAWVMRKSWSNPLMIGYEIKVSRSDFLGDDKWPEYLKYCNEFYFVTPSGLVDKEELPEGVGLIQCSKTGTRLFTKRKAVYRDIEPPSDLLKYIIMCRAEIIKSSYNQFQSSDDKLKGREYWERFVEDKEAKFELGQRCSAKLTRLFKERVESVLKENQLLCNQMKAYDQVVNFCEQNNIDISRGEYGIRNQLRQALEIFPDNFKWGLKRMAENSEELLERITEMEKKAE